MSILKLAMVAIIVYLLWSLVLFVLKVRKIASFFKSSFNPLNAAQAAAGAARRARKRSNVTPGSQAPQNAMVKCAKCDLYVIDSDAISRGGELFCSPEHAQAFHT